MPNSETSVVAQDGKLRIELHTTMYVLCCLPPHRVYTKPLIRNVEYGMEVTWDYSAENEEHGTDQALCLCGLATCTGQYLRQAEPKSHDPRHMLKLLLEACQARSLSSEDQKDLDSAGFGTRLLPTTAPLWLKIYCARVINYLRNFGQGNDWQNLAIAADCVQSLLVLAKMPQNYVPVKVGEM